MQLNTRSWLLAALAATLPLSGWAQTRELGSTGQLLDGVAAVVDSGVVLRSELEERLALVVSSLRQQQGMLPPEQRRPLPPLSVLERQVLEQLIVRQIQLQRAARLGIVVSDEMLNQAISQVAAEIGLTLEQMPTALATEGIEYTMYRQDTREELVLDQLEQRDVINRISVSPREMEQCLARLEVTQTDDFDYHVSHILIGLSASAGQEELRSARERAEEVSARLEAGEDFAQLAVEYSEGQTALEGGSLGWRKGSQLPTLFADRVVRMEPGEFSDPIQSGSGFHIVQLNEMRGAEPVMVDQLRVRHILLAPNEIMDDAAVQQRLLGIRQQILDGDEFATHAQATSEDALSAADGGDLGWVAPGTFVPEFEQVLAQLDEGQLSEPFRTRFGWHIAEVTDRRRHDTTEEMKRQTCQRQIRAGKAEEERELWLRRLRDQAFVDYRI